jgi:hypothetical protein
MNMYYFSYMTRIGEGRELVSVEIEFDRDEDSTFDRSVLSIKLNGTEISGCFTEAVLDELAKGGADMYMEGLQNV